MKRPSTKGTTARLALAGLWSVLAVVAGAGAVLCWLVTTAAPESLPASLDALQGIVAPALLALGGLGSVGSVAHGARHLGGAPAPTTAELQAVVPAEAA